MEKRPPITRGYVQLVQHALQGHPESPQLWAKMIDGIIRKNSFMSTTHEPCLYSATIDGHKTYFLRQVDDFAVLALYKEITDKIFAMIQAKLTEPLKMLNKINQYNGI